MLKKIKGYSKLVLVLSFILLVSLSLSGCDMGYSDSVEDTSLTIEEMKEMAIQIDYRELKRNPEENKNTVVESYGKIAQRIPNTDNAYRVHITEGEFIWTDDVYIRVDYATYNLIEDDIIYFVGITRGDITYRTVLGSQRTIPLIDVYYAELK